MRTPNTRPNASRNRTLAGAPPAVNIRTHDQLTPMERRFLESAEHGDRPTLLAEMWRSTSTASTRWGGTAIEIACDNENLEIVELLLQQDGIRIGNALLCAIREGVYRLVEMLVNHPSINKEMLGDGWCKSLDPSDAVVSEYSNDISPLMLAAHLNRFEILQMLLRTGATIERPHRYSCLCELCDRERLNDSLYHSLKRINTYRALASPAWISLTSSDPILSAFRLSYELQHLANRENEFKDTYLQLAEQCKQFACDLLSQCRSTEEVIAILNKEENTNDENVEVWASKLSLSRLKLAIKYEQKAFVSHPHTQQLLTSIWHEGVPWNVPRGSRWNLGIYALLIVLWPILAMAYIIMPKSRIGRIVRSPFMKFLSYSIISFGCFLLLLTMVTLEAYKSGKGETSRASDRGAPPTLIETLVWIWVIGIKLLMGLSEVQMQMWEEGVENYVVQAWNWLDVLMMILYLSTISIRQAALSFSIKNLCVLFRLSAYFIYVYNNDGSLPRYLLRVYWHAYEPILVAEALFAVGNVLSFARIIYPFQITPYLGPLQISLGCMLVDVAKFCFIFALIISSFAFGLAQLYWYYEAKAPVCLTPDNCVTVPNVFSSITKIEDTDVAEEHDFTQWVGRGLFILYHCTAIIVLLNMLIAMLSLSFQNIQNAADMEWKYHPNFDEGSTLPPPFNIIPTPKGIWYVVRAVVNTIKWASGRYQYQKNRNRATIRRPGFSRKTKELERNNTVEGEPTKKQPLTYTGIIQRLVARFIHQTKKDMKMDGVNEDSLLEIKQDISSLRYELRDDRVKEIARSSSQIDAVKRDIVRTMSMSTATRMFGPHRQARQRASVAEEDSDYDESDEEIKSHGESIFASNLSPTTSHHFDLPAALTSADSPAPRPERGRHSSVFTSTHAGPLAPTSIQTSPISTKQRASLQKSVPPPLLAGNIPQRTPVETVERLRHLMNQRLDQLVSQMAAGSLPQERTELPLETIEPPQRTRTPASAPPRSSSPPRVAFSLITSPETRKND
ncbi:hypothetical protein M3Y99_00500200 [Aphelenchoides fujianensis]|nr:hypothetical protein M3Y99_00500200 [Aphelenchoides fujianensis]